MTRDAGRRGPRRTVPTAFVVALATLAGGCPPPPDAPRGGDAVERPTPVPEVPGAAAPAAPPAGVPGTPAPTPGAPTAGAGSTTPVAPRPTTDTVPVVYESLRGGVAVPRCPSCGETLAEGAAACPGCRQPVSPWRHEETCPRCVGEGLCDHCGDDRVCLACDGDGKCGACGGEGSLTRGGACPECAGNRQCIACRGDGRRERATRDLLPTEGWMPGSCATCLDGAGLCPECGASGANADGNPCATCAGNRVCPDCAGEGVCTWCASDGECPECGGSGFLVRNGAPRGPDDRVRRLRTAAGSPVRARAEGPPTATAARLVFTEGGRATSKSMARDQLDPLSWILLARDFPPGWDGRDAADPVAVAAFRVDLAQTAIEAALWGPALGELRTALALDPANAANVRTLLADLEQRRAESWSKKADEAERAGDRDRAVALLEGVVFAARGSALAKRSELRILELRKTRETERANLAETEKVRRETDAKSSVDRAIARARGRLGRAQVLLDRAARGEGDAAPDRTFARAEFSAWLAQRTVQTAASRHAPAAVPWETSVDAIVTEARRVSANVLSAWATHAVAGGRFALGERLARRGLAAAPADAALQAILTQAQAGRARNGVLQGSPPPGRR